MCTGDLNSDVYDYTATMLVMETLLAPDNSLVKDVTVGREVAVTLQHS